MNKSQSLKISGDPVIEGAPTYCEINLQDLNQVLTVYRREKFHHPSVKERGKETILEDTRGFCSS